MSLNATPSSERTTISFFGRRNAGKSSLVNAITNQDLSVVSEIKGTTTDPVIKTMELLPIGPIVIIDTPGIDDEGVLGSLRVKKTKEVLNRTDIAVLVVDSTEGFTPIDEELLLIIQEKNLPHIIAFNKSDLLKKIPASEDTNRLYVSAKSKDHVDKLLQMLGSLQDTSEHNKKLIADLISPGDYVVLVIPIDSAAPKGRLILPQQMVLRDILDAGGIGIVLKENELENALNQLPVKPALVITDSQVFKQVSAIVPKEVPLTSFSILMARYKGFLNTALKGVSAICNLKDDSKVLISEGCTHHRQCGDIGTCKLPYWLKSFSGKKLEIVTSSGHGFPEDLSDYDCVIHCGGCMLSEKELLYRMKQAIDQNVPFTNYGIAIAQMNGILSRSIEMLPKES